MIIYDSGGMYRYYKAEYPNNPYVIQDEDLQNKLRMMNYENGLCLCGDAYEVYAWHPDYPNRIAVSDMGNVVDLALGVKLRQFSALDEYYRIKIDGKINFIHRLIAIIFIPNLYPSINTVVNHKDGIKSHNWVTNLEWITNSANTSHAINVLGTPSAQTIYTWDQKITIIKMLVDGCSEKEIADAINHDISDRKEHLRFRKTLSRVRKGCWIEVWQHLGLTPKMAYRPKDYREKIKEIMKQNMDIDYRTLAKMVGEPYNDAFICLAGRIKRDLKANSQANNNTLNLNSSVIDKIAFLIDKGLSIKEISQETGIPDNEYFYALIQNMKSGALYGNITRKYKSFPNYNPYYSI